MSSASPRLLQHRADRAADPATYAKLAIVGPQVTSRTAGALFTEGGSGAQISGAFYVPNARSR